MVYQYDKRQVCFNQKLQQLIYEVDELRIEHPGCGVEKMYYTLQPDFIGRDLFIYTFMELGYCIKLIKNYRRTPYAGSIYYPNIIKGLLVKVPLITIFDKENNNQKMIKTIRDVQAVNLYQEHIHL